MKRLGTIDALGLIVSLALGPRLSYGGHDDDDYGNNHGHGKHDEYNGKHKHHKHHKHGDDERDYGYEHYDYRGPYFKRQRVTIIRNYYTPEEIDRLPPGFAQTPGAHRASAARIGEKAGGEPAAAPEVS
jgi:hypothetical protein